MAERLFQGRTNNHISWVMVDATDALTPESALSAATKIKIYGKLQGATGVNFVSSGTGSLTNDIQHVGASVLGIYTIALAKPDLSDASAAFYDHYVISLSATGAAYQTLIAEGVLSGGNVSNISAAISDVQSYLVVMSGIQSDILSAAVALSDAVSNAYSAAVVGASRVLLVQSRLSDLDSRLVSDLSDILSAVRGNSDYLSKMSDVLSNAYSAAAQGASRVLLVQSRLSDFDSRMVSDVSDILSAIGAITVNLTASDVSDIASAVVAAIGFTTSGIAAKVWSDFTSRAGASPSQLYSVVLIGSSAASDAASAAQQANSRVLLIQSRLSDLDSRLVSDVSDILSMVRGTSDTLSVVAGNAAIGASAARQGASRALVAQSLISDVDSALTSQFLITTSTLSDIDSAVSSQFTALQTQLPSSPVKNAVFTYVIKMVLAADHVTPATGLSITFTRDLGSGFGAATGTVTEIATGHYRVAASASDMNGDTVTHRFIAATADDLTMEFMTVS